MEELNRKSVDDFRKAEKLPLVLVLENIRSMHNVGSAFRSSDAFLVSRILLTGYTPRPPHRDIQKTALGATESVEWSYHENSLDPIKELKDIGYRVYAVEQVEGSIKLQNLHCATTPGPTVLIFGNEVEGVSKEAISLADGCIEIPQSGTKHSLNISVAVGIVLWEFAKNYESVIPSADASLSLNN